MTYQFTGLLVSTAEFSNLLSFFAVLGGLLFMFVFLMRLIYQDIADGGGSGTTHVTQSAPQTQMTRITVPFTLTLSPDQTLSSPGVRLRLSSSVPYLARVYWGVDIPTFHHVLQAPWPWFREAFLHGRLFGVGCLEYGRTLQEREPHSERLEEVKRRKEKLELGPAPRGVYPMVVIQVRREEGGPVAGLLSVVHLKDEVCPIPSQVLVSYLRQGEGSTLLRPLYLSEGEGREEGSDTDSVGEREEESRPGVRDEEEDSIPRVRCVVCQLDRVTRVSLPCRHAVTCRDCFQRCKNRCPMCRGYVTSYFLLSPEESSNKTTTDTTEEERPPSWRERWRGWGRRVNIVMGAQEH